MIEQERQALEFPPREISCCWHFHPLFWEVCWRPGAPVLCPQLKFRSCLLVSFPTLPLKLLLLAGDGRKWKWDLLGNTEGPLQLLCRAGSSQSRRWSGCKLGFWTQEPFDLLKDQMRSWPCCRPGRMELVTRFNRLLTPKTESHLAGMRIVSNVSEEKILFIKLWFQTSNDALHV